MIVGVLHLQKVRRVGQMFSTEAKVHKDDMTRFDFSAETPLEVIGMLENVLATLRGTYEAEAKAKAAAEAAAKPEREGE